MTRNAKRREVGQEAPMVITPSAVVRLLKQIASTIRRKSKR
jgi:hypothetical protein